MKIIAVDISRNATSEKIKSFLKSHIDADIIYTFDFKYYKYDSMDKLIKALDLFPDEFFSKPCAYYDMVSIILGKATEYAPKSITVFSPEEDDCNRG